MKPKISHYPIYPGMTADEATLVVHLLRREAKVKAQEGDRVSSREILRFANRIDRNNR